MSAGLAVLKVLASSCSVIMILSSAPSIHAIHKHRETGDVALSPLVGLWLNCVMIWASGSYFPRFATYVFGTMVSTAYIGVYFRWKKGRTYALKAISAAFVANVVGSAYIVLDQPSRTDSWEHDGCCLFAALRRPLRDDQDGIEDAVGCLHPLQAGATSNLIWTIERLYTDDMFILFLSAACSALGFVKVALYLVFRPRTTEKVLEVDVTVASGKTALPVTSQPTKMEKDICPCPVAEPVQTRCLDKIEIISPCL